jgi:hypothetical protein
MNLLSACLVVLVCGKLTGFLSPLAFLATVLLVSIALIRVAYAMRLVSAETA